MTAEHTCELGFTRDQQVSLQWCHVQIKFISLFLNKPKRSNEQSKKTINEHTSGDSHRILAVEMHKSQILI